MYNDVLTEQPWYTCILDKPEFSHFISSILFLAILVFCGRLLINKNEKSHANQPPSWIDKLESWFLPLNKETWHGPDCRCLVYCFQMSTNALHTLDCCADERHIKSCFVLLEEISLSLFHYLVLLCFIILSYLNATCPANL